MRGLVESIANHQITGWCFQKKEPMQPVLVTVFIDGKQIAGVVADAYRPDLEKKIHPTGKCGFIIDLPSSIEYNGQPIEVKANNVNIAGRFVAFLNEKPNIEINRIQMYGERASGTNFLRQLVGKNIPNIPFTYQYGWKHFFPPENLPGSEKCLFLVIYRDPYDWVRSLSMQPHHVHESLKKISFNEFIRKEWQCVWDELANIHPEDEKYGQEMMFERDPKTGERFSNVLKLRTAKIEAFESLRNRVKHIVYIRYEDLVKDPDHFLQLITHKYNLCRMPDFVPIAKYKGITYKKFKPKVYFYISANDLLFIQKNLSIDVERSIGYNLLSHDTGKNILTVFEFLYRRLKNYFK